MTKRSGGHDAARKDETMDDEQTTQAQQAKLQAITEITNRIRAYGQRRQREIQPPRVVIKASRNYGNQVEIGPVSRETADELAVMFAAREYDKIEMTDVPEALEQRPSAPDATDDHPFI